MKIIVSRQELLAALLFASTDDSRYTLSGVHIEAKPFSTPVLVATDGRRLVCIETVAQQSDDDPVDEPHSLLLRPDYVKLFAQLSKACGGKNFPWVCLQNNPGSKRVTVTLIGGNIALDIESGALIEGAFPNWRKVIPAKSKKREPISDLGLNAEFVGDFGKAAKLLEVESPLIAMNLVGKDNQIEVKLTAAPHFYGLVMPCKLNESIDYQPEFLGIVEGFQTAAATEAA